MRALLVACCALLSPVFGQVGVLGTSANALFASNANIAAVQDAVAIAPDGSWICSLSSNTNVGDVIVTEVDPAGALVGSQALSFPSSVNVSAGNPGIVISPDSRFAVVLGSGGTGDLVLIRRATSSGFESVLVDYGAGTVPALGTIPVVSPDGRFIATLGAGSSSDLVLVPITTGPTGLVTPGTAILVAYGSANNVPQVTGIRPWIRFDGRAVATTGTSTTGDIVITTLPVPLTSAGITTSNISYAGGNSVSAVTAPIFFAPDGSYCATFGQPNLGDVVVTPLGATGSPGSPQNVLFASSNNAQSTSASLVSDAAGRVLATIGTISAGDLVLIPIDTAGVPGTPLNISYPASNFVPAGSPQASFSETGRFVVTSGSPTIGDLVVTRVTYSASGNSVSPVPVNVLFPGANDRRTVSAPWAISNDGSFVAVFGSNPTVGDLVLVPVAPDGTPGSAQNLAYPGSTNVPTYQDRPAIDPRGTFIVSAGEDLSSDLVLVTLERNPLCVQALANIETHVFAASNNGLSTSTGPRVSPSGQFILTEGSPTIGDLVITPFLDSRIFLLDSPEPGRTLRLRLSSPISPSLPYVLAASLTPCPGILLADGRTLPLTPDFLFSFSLIVPNPNLVSFQGFLDSSGIGEALVILPSLPSLRGTALTFAFATGAVGAPSGILDISKPASVVIQ